jgi:Transcriptional regulator of a riboflavin/FAD biosynthetic operon
MEVETLKRLALMGANREQVSLSSSIFASTLGTSPQTAARKLSSLEDDGYIARVVTSEGQKVRITEKGILRLRQEYLDYVKVFEEPHGIVIRGRVTTGLGEGQYYISLDGYRRQFNQKLGFDPFPGTLNLKLNEPFVPPEQDAIKIDGFKDENRTFGGCKCYKINIRGIHCAIVRPDRTSYSPTLVEIIAPVNLRKALGVGDGDEVEVLLE